VSALFGISQIGSTRYRERKKEGKEKDRVGRKRERERERERERTRSRCQRLAGGMKPDLGLRSRNLPRDPPG